VRAGLLAGGIALLISAAGTALVGRLVSRLLVRVEQRTRELQQEIADRQQAEETLRRRDEQVRESQKLEAIGELASGIAHDFSNLITVIFASSEELRGSLKDQNGGDAALDQIQRAAEQARGITNSLLAFSRNVPLEKSHLHLRTIVDKAAALLRHTLPASIELIVDELDEPIGWVLADETQLQQVLFNLGINARDAMPSGGTLRLSLSLARDRATGDMATPPPPGTTRFARITMADTGTGIPAELRSRIFEPFFTTKTRGGGTGLGLSIVHGIVKEHGGYVEVESGAARGAKFSIYLPCVSSLALSGERRALQTASRAKGELVLLAEQHEQVRAALASALELVGCKVVQAEDEPSLLKRFAERRASVQLLVIDTDLPGRAGLVRLTKLRAEGVAVPAVVITGAAGLPAEQLADHDVVLRKPFPMSEFVETVTKVLASSDAQAIS
jgi:signal transduction histidine kinase/CheY-like chemotaxis protein